MEFLLITGVPGSGKTTIGNYLQEKYGFLHLNIEEWSSWDQSLSKLRDFFLGNKIVEFIGEAEQINNKIVITWGFMPGDSDNTILELIRLGFKMIWFDGDRNAAREAFVKREDGSAQALEALEMQMKRINAMNLKQFNAAIIDTFDSLVSLI